MSFSNFKYFFSFLESRYGISHFPTSKLTQDCVENFFSWIRASSITYINPTGLDFIYRFRKYLMSKTSVHYAEKTNCEKDSIFNICAESLFTDEINTDSVLSSELMTQLTEPEEDETVIDEDILDESSERGSGLDQPEGDSTVADEVIFDGSSGANLHHRSNLMRSLVDSLVTKNGVAAMACLLVQKW